MGCGLLWLLFGTGWTGEGLEMSEGVRALWLYEKTGSYELHVLVMWHHWPLYIMMSARSLDFFSDPNTKRKVLWRWQDPHLSAEEVLRHREVNDIPMSAQPAQRQSKDPTKGFHASRQHNTKILLLEQANSHWGWCLLSTEVKKKKKKRR